MGEQVNTSGRLGQRVRARQAWRNPQEVGHHRVIAGDRRFLRVPLTGNDVGREADQPLPGCIGEGVDAEALEITGPVLLELVRPEAEMRGGRIPRRVHGERLEVDRPRGRGLVHRALERDPIAMNVPEHADLLVEVGLQFSANQWCALVIDGYGYANLQPTLAGKPGQDLQAPPVHLAVRYQPPGKPFRERAVQRSTAEQCIAVDGADLRPAQQPDRAAPVDESGHASGGHAQRG